MKGRTKPILGLVAAASLIGVAAITVRGDRKNTGPASVTVARTDIVDKALAVGTIVPEVEVSVKARYRAWSSGASPIPAISSGPALRPRDQAGPDSARAGQTSAGDVADSGRQSYARGCAHALADEQRVYDVLGRKYELDPQDEDALGVGYQEQQNFKYLCITSRPRLAARARVCECGPHGGRPNAHSRSRSYKLAL